MKAKARDGHATIKICNPIKKMLRLCHANVKCLKRLITAAFVSS